MITLLCVIIAIQFIFGIISTVMLMIAIKEIKGIIKDGIDGIDNYVTHDLRDKLDLNLRTCDELVEDVGSQLGSTYQNTCLAVSLLQELRHHHIDTIIPKLVDDKNQPSEEPESAKANQTEPEPVVDQTEDNGTPPHHDTVATDISPACRSSLYYFPPAIGHHITIQLGGRKLNGAPFPIIYNKKGGDYNITAPYAVLKCDFDILEDADACKILLPCFRNGYYKLTGHPYRLMRTFPFFLMFVPENAETFGHPETITVKGVILHGSDGKWHDNPQCIMCDQINEDVPYYVYTDLATTAPGTEITQLEVKHGHVGDIICNVMIEGLTWYRKKSAAEYYRGRAEGIKQLNSLVEDKDR